MTDGPAVVEDLMIVTTDVSLIPEEVNLLETFTLEVLQAVRLVPAIGKDIKADLTADAVRQTNVRKFLPQRFDHIFAHVVDLVVSLKVVPLALRARPTDWTNIEHSIAELNECAPLHRQIYFCEVTQAVIDELLQLLLSHMFLYADPGNLNAILKIYQPVLGKYVVEFLDYFVAVHLLGYLLHIGPAHNTNQAAGLDLLVYEFLEVRFDLVPRLCQCSVHIEKTQNLLARHDVQDGYRWSEASLGSVVSAVLNLLRRNQECTSYSR